MSCLEIIDDCTTAVDVIARRKRGGHNYQWQPFEVETLRSMFALGYTDNEIGEKLQRSANSIMHKRYSLRLSGGRPTTIRTYCSDCSVEIETGSKRCLRCHRLFIKKTPVVYGRPCSGQQFAMASNWQILPDGTRLRHIGDLKESPP